MKSEKEKMLSGENYDGGDSQLVAERLLARELCFKFNQASPTSINVREEIIDKLINIKNLTILRPILIVTMVIT